MSYMRRDCFGNNHALSLPTMFALAASKAAVAPPHRALRAQVSAENDSKSPDIVKAPRKSILKKQSSLSVDDSHGFSNGLVPDQPSVTASERAGRVGRSAARWRSVRRSRYVAARLVHAR